MSDVSKPGEGEVVSGSLPVPYVTDYTNQTWTLGPFVVPAIAGGAFLLVEWGTLRWMDHAPTSVWLCTTAIGICILVVVAMKGWLDFKNPRYFSISLAGLLVTWVTFLGAAYYWEANSVHEIDPAVTNLQSQLATARRERDVAVLEREAARRDAGNTNPTPTPSPSPDLAKLKADDIDARIDAWNGVEGQMSDFARILGEGDDIVNNWRSDQTRINALAMDFRNHLATSRNRLANLIGSYPDFSDLKVIDQNVPTKLSQALDNLFGATSQLSGAATASEYESSIGRYINPLKRQLTAVKRWAETTKNVADSSVSELSANRKE